MRQETNNEMDLLLRRLSRRQEEPVSDDDSNHLDVDELSSYAENALPAAARARYTEHLAECSRCRELVVQLSGSVPVVAAGETVTAVGPSGLLKFLASFFSPMVLRYAVPALAVIVVGAIGFVVLRSNRQPESMARLNSSPQSSPAQTQDEQTASGFLDQGRTVSPSPEGDVAGRTALAPTEQAKPPATPNAEPAAAAKVDASRDAPPPIAERQAVANSAPAAPVAPAPGATVDEVRVEVEGRRANESQRAPTGDLAKQKASDDSREQEKKAEVSAARRAGTGSATVTQSGTNSAFSIDGKEKDSRDDGVIRSAGGRRFRKQNGVWVDTAYDSGSAIVNVSRGSEQYRALIADEPTIKSIADELEGTIVVVWKGRTYRIR